MPEKDAKFLELAKCDVLFLPSVDEIYPKKDETIFDFGFLDKTLDGKHRPGHFNGVAQVVKRLFEIVTPDKAFFGEKDYQQVMIIKALVKQMGSSIEIVSCPILREADGLAMSSRNVRLSKEGRKLAPVLYKVLQEVEYYVNSQPFPIPKKAIELAMNLFQQHGIENIDYFEIVDAETLQELHSFEDSNFAVVCAVIVIDGVRLLDNVILFEK
jgi:pantoate--beta-alanine ligase